MNAANKQKRYSSVKDYIEHLISDKKLARELVIYQNLIDGNDQVITINDQLVVEGKKVKQNLDWSIVSAKRVVFEGRAVEDYAKLPGSVRGVSGDVPMPDNFELFISKNAQGRYQSENGKIVVEGNLAIHKMKDMDMSRLKVNGVILWYAGTIDFDQMPEAKKILNLRPGQIKSSRKLKAHELEAKGILPTKSFLGKLVDTFSKN